MLKDLTRGERLVIARRRDDQSQSEAAEDHGVSRKLYAQWERDEVPGPEVVGLGALKPHEQCFLARRRSGFSREEVAHAIDCSAFWVTQMERGRRKCDRLLNYWKARS